LPDNDDTTGLGPSVVHAHIVAQAVQAELSARGADVQYGDMSDSGYGSIYYPSCEVDGHLAFAVDTDEGEWLVLRHSPTGDEPDRYDEVESDALAALTPCDPAARVADVIAGIIAFTRKV